MLDAKEIGKRIKTRQIELGYKQKDIIEKTGLSKAAICNYVNGTKVPSTEAAIKICKALNISMEWLVKGESTKVNLLPEEIELIKAYRNSSEEKKEIIRNIMNVKTKQEAPKLYDSKIS